MNQSCFSAPAPAPVLCSCSCSFIPFFSSSHVPFASSSPSSFFPFDMNSHDFSYVSSHDVLPPSPPLPQIIISPHFSPTFI